MRATLSSLLFAGAALVACGGATTSAVATSGPDGASPSADADASLPGSPPEDASPPREDAGGCVAACLVAHREGESEALLGLYDCMTKTACSAPCAPAVRQREWTAACLQCVRIEEQAGRCETHCNATTTSDCTGFEQCVAACP